jgi:hypothetical protein
MSAATCPVCGQEAGDRVEELQGQGAAKLVLLICKGCGNVFTEKSDRPCSCSCSARFGGGRGDMSEPGRSPPVVRKNSGWTVLMLPVSLP